MINLLAVSGPALAKFLITVTTWAGLADGPLAFVSAAPAVRELPCTVA
jgi:hypothetical protein